MSIEVSVNQPKAKAVYVIKTQKVINRTFGLLPFRIVNDK